MHIICWKINKFKGVEGLKIRGAHTNTRAVCLTSISLDIFNCMVGIQKFSGALSISIYPDVVDRKDNFRFKTWNIIYSVGNGSIIDPIKMGIQANT